VVDSGNIFEFDEVMYPPGSRTEANRLTTEPSVSGYGLGLGMMIRRLLGSLFINVVVFASIAIAQKPVDTHQFGLIQLRMHKEEVQERLGPPAKIMHDPHYEIPDLLELMGGQYVACHYAYYYPSSFQVPATVICFAGDRVSGKWRIRR
jgi:hypothetical protein